MVWVWLDGNDGAGRRQSVGANVASMFRIKWHTPFDPEIKKQERG